MAGPSTAARKKREPSLRMTDLGWGGECDQAKLDTPRFAKYAKGRAPRLCRCGEEPIQRSFTAFRMTRVVADGIGC